ncbi:MAG: hypothetical protein ACT4PS_13075 [Betaproteobacteria bacterium]
MKIVKATLVLAALASAVISAPVFAHGGRGHHFRGHNNHHHFHRHSRARIGVFIGAPLALTPWYYYPRYYSPPAVVVHTPPPVYVERGQPADDAQYWYYCRESETYYPYVKECAGPWQKVVPQPPSS